MATASHSPQPPERRAFRRSAPGHQVLALTVPCVVLGYGIGMTLAVVLGITLKETGTLGPLLQRFGDGVYGGLTLVVIAVIALAFMLSNAVAGRRWGAAVIGDEGVWLDVGLKVDEERLAKLTPVPLHDVQGWSVTPHGLLLEVEGRGRLSRLFFPLLIPTDSPAEVDELEALLRRRSPRGAPPAPGAGPGAGPGSSPPAGPDRG